MSCLRITIAMIDVGFAEFSLLVCSFPVLFWLMLQKSADLESQHLQTKNVWVIGATPEHVLDP